MADSYRKVRVVLGSTCDTPLIHEPIEVQFSVGNNWVPPSGPMKFPPPPPPPPKEDGEPGKGESGDKGGGKGDDKDGEGGKGGKEDGGDGKGKGGGGGGGAGKGSGGKNDPKGSSNVGAVADGVWAAMKAEEDRTNGDSVQTGQHPVARGSSDAKARGYPEGMGYMVDFTLYAKDEINIYVSDSTQMKVAVEVEEGPGDFAVKFPTEGGKPVPPDPGGGTPTPPDPGGGTPTPPDPGGGTPVPPPGPIDKAPKGRVIKVKPGKGGWYLLTSSGISSNGHMAGPMLGDQWQPTASTPVSYAPAGNFLNTVGHERAPAVFGSAVPSPEQMFSASMFWKDDAELFAAPKSGPSPETAFSLDRNPLVATAVSQVGEPSGPRLRNLEQAPGFGGTRAITHSAKGGAVGQGQTSKESPVIDSADREARPAFPASQLTPGSGAEHASLVDPGQGALGSAPDRDSVASEVQASAAADDSAHARGERRLSGPT